MDVVDNIDRIRKGAIEAGNTDKKFLESLNTVLSDLKAEYYSPKPPGATRVGNDDDDDDSVKDSIDELRESKVSQTGSRSRVSAQDPMAAGNKKTGRSITDSRH